MAEGDKKTEGTKGDGDDVGVATEHSRARGSLEMVTLVASLPGALIELENGAPKTLARLLGR